VAFNRNTIGVICRAGNPNPSGVHELTPVSSMVQVTKFVLFCVVFCRLLFVNMFFFLLTIVLSVLLRYTISDYLWYLQTFLLLQRTNNEHLLEATTICFFYVQWDLPSQSTIYSFPSRLEGDLILYFIRPIQQSDGSFPGKHLVGVFSLCMVMMSYIHILDWKVKNIMPNQLSSNI